ncbi:MAG: laccase domain-containing protein [Deltaproteobacteria bacterium]|nr:laccase domain-containing protein [Deltaproteobacteria bacterium]
MTQKPGVLIGIRTADCVPILVYDPEQRAVGAIHAGWRGLIAGIIENSIGTMREKFLTNPKNLAVVVGAALCPGCFEIGPEVAEAFRKRFGDRLEPVSDPSKAESVTGSCARRALTITAGRGDRSFVDLRKGCELALADSGLSEKNLEFLPYCTACHRELFYSHRKGDTDKRQMAFIGVKSNF